MSSHLNLSGISMERITINRNADTVVLIDPIRVIKVFKRNSEDWTDWSESFSMDNPNINSHQGQYYDKHFQEASLSEDGNSLGFHTFNDQYFFYKYNYQLNLYLLIYLLC